MKLMFSFAFKNLIGAGLRTWINLTVLGAVYLIVVFLQGFYDGFQASAEHSRIAQETGREQLWFHGYDPLDPLSLRDSHGLAPLSLSNSSEVAPILIVTAAAYPHGKSYPVTMRGIPADQTVLDLPTSKLVKADVAFPAIVGKRMADKLQLGRGDTMVVSWRTDAGARDAQDVTIVDIFHTNAPASDVGVIWVDLNLLQKKFEASGHATILVARQSGTLTAAPSWQLKTENELLADTRKMMEAERGGASFLYAILMFLAGISILDTQILTIFRRRKEVGLLLALGLTGRQIVGVFTFEGLILGLLATTVAAAIGGPLCWYTASHGINMMDMAQFGIAGSSLIYPTFSVAKVVTTVVILNSMITLLSYWPAKRIGKLRPADALRGSWT